MSIQIDCPDCHGKKIVCKSECGYRMNIQAGSCTKDVCEYKKYCNKCDDNGYVKVYTQSEVDSLVGAEKDSCIMDITEYFHNLSKQNYIKVGTDAYADMNLRRDGIINQIKSRSK